LKTKEVLQNKIKTKSLRAKLTVAFVIFVAINLALLWAMQSVFLQDYYRASMQRKINNAVNEVSLYYEIIESLNYDDFCEKLGSVATKSDVFFYVESLDKTFSISSTEMSMQGRFFNKRFLEKAQSILQSSGQSSISYIDDSAENETVICAVQVDSPYRGSIYLYAIAPLTPLGPAISIIRTQLMWVTFIVLAVGIIISAIVSKRFAKPLVEMSQEATKLGQGDFDVNFKGADYKEINELADTLNNAAKELKASDDLNKDLLANVSHDLRTPLTMIKSYAEMIRDLSGENKEKREEHLNVIIEETDRMANLVSDILTLSKMQAGVDELYDAEFDLSETAESVFATYKIVEQDGFEMNIKGIDNPCVVFADQRRISQVIANLLSNAIRYSDNEKYVELALSVESNKVICSVTDHGIGIPAEDRDKIWNRYQKASRTGRRSDEGSGLGLSICAEILKREKADFGINAVETGGSIFWFSLPLKK